MPSALSEKDLELLGYTNVVRKDSDRNEGDPWRLFDATALAGVRHVTHRFAYIGTSATLEQARRLQKQVNLNSDFFLVTPRSGISIENLKGIFGTYANVSYFEDLIWSRLQEQFSEYVKSLNDGITKEKYYVAPRSSKTQGPQDRLDKEISDFLRGSTPGGKLQVISAAAGVGKTTLARQVILGLADKYNEFKSVPTFVESSHWSKLRLDSVDDLWEIIDNSLGNFSKSLSIKQDLFEHAVKQGYVTFVFDGFDELCTQRQSRFSARDVLNQLIELVAETDARVVITTRTLFWDAEIGETPPSCEVHYLRPFEAPQAKDYFQKYFKNDRVGAERSLNLYKQLIEQSQRPRESGGGRVQFANLPMCVGMIARFAQEGGTTLDLTEEGTVIERFLLQILERECARQGLRTKAKEQFSAFEEVAVLCALQGRCDFELELLVAGGFSEVDANKLGVHPLVSTLDGKTYSFGYEFLETYLVASNISRLIASGNTHDQSSIKLMGREANGKGFVIEHISEMLGNDGLELVGAFYRSLGSKNVQSKSFLFHLAKSLAEGSGQFVTGRDKAVAIFRSLCGEEFSEKAVASDLNISGSVDRIDLSGITFLRGLFADVSFVRCKADQATRFSGCRFAGDLQFEDCSTKEWGLVQLEDDCILEPPTHLVWEGILGKNTGSKKDHIRDAIQLALGKFWVNGRLKGSIRREDWRKGTLGHSIYCQSLLSEMLKHKLILQVTISGASEGGYAFNREALGDLQTFMDNRQAVGLIKTVGDSMLNSGS